MLNKTRLPLKWVPHVSSLVGSQQFVHEGCLFIIGQPSEDKIVDLYRGFHNNLLQVIDVVPATPDSCIFVSYNQAIMSAAVETDSAGKIRLAYDRTKCDLLYTWDRKYEFWKLDPSLVTF